MGPRVPSDVVEALLNAKSFRESTQSGASSSTSSSLHSAVDRARRQQEDRARQVCDNETLARCGDPACTKLHYRPVMTAVTDGSLGLCAQPSDCQQMATTCRYVHRVVDRRSGGKAPPPPQWINCDVRQFDMSILGKFDVIMADPPWFIRQKVRLAFAL